MGQAHKSNHPSSGSSASSDSNHPEPHPDVTDLVCGADQARGWYAAATVEVERLKNSLAAMEVALKEEDAETADALARVTGEVLSCGSDRPVRGRAQSDVLPLLGLE